MQKLPELQPETAKGQLFQIRPVFAAFDGDPPAVPDHLRQDPDDPFPRYGLSRDGAYVLHRIIGVCGSDRYRIAGDNRTFAETGTIH